MSAASLLDAITDVADAHRSASASALAGKTRRGLTLGKDRHTLLENFLNSFKPASGLTCRKPRITGRRPLENTGQP
jgi:hypothetical protein